VVAIRSTAISCCASSSCADRLGLVTRIGQRVVLRSHVRDPVSIETAIELNDRASLRTSPGPCSGARAASSPALNALAAVEYDESAVNTPHQDTRRRARSATTPDKTRQSQHSCYARSPPSRSPATGGRRPSVMTARRSKQATQGIIRRLPSTKLASTRAPPHPSGRTIGSP